ncbi:MAG: hypothetical protein R3F59_14800 [Myxococcota bacterium]
MPPGERAPFLRVVVFVLAAVHLQVGSVYQQLLHRRAPPTTMSWEMYGSVGSKVCATAWFVRTADGALAPLDRQAAEPAPRRFLRTQREVQDAARRLCRTLGADVRVEARCATRGGGPWRSVFQPDDQLCIPGAGL